MSPGFFRKAVLAGIFGLAALGAGYQLRNTGAPPCVREEERDNQVTASVAGGSFNYSDDKAGWRWEYRFPPGTTREGLERALSGNGYEKFFDPFHDGANYKKTINGRWYHYIVHDDARIESHWERSEPGSLSHAADFWRPWRRPPESKCPDAPKP